MGKVKNVHPVNSIVLRRAMQNVLQHQKQQTMLPQKIVLTIKNIWQLQYQLAQKKKIKTNQLLAHPKFRAAYDFLLLRAQAGEKVQDLAAWWTQIQGVNANSQQQMNQI